MVFSQEKGDRHLLCEAPEGPFRQKVPVTFSIGRVLPQAPMKHQLEKLQRQGLAVHAAVLGLSALLLYGLVAPLAGFYGGQDGVIAAAVALGLCLSGTGSALVVSHFFRDPDRALHGMLLGMLPRMGIPLSIGLLIHLQNGFLSQSGLLYYLLLFYPVTLTVETILSLPPTGMRQANSSSPQSPSLNTEQRSHG